MTSLMEFAEPLKCPVCNLDQAIRDEIKNALDKKAVNLGIASRWLASQHKIDISSSQLRRHFQLGNHEASGGKSRGFNHNA